MRTHDMNATIRRHAFRSPPRKCAPQHLPDRRFRQARAELDLPGYLVGSQLLTAEGAQFIGAYLLTGMELDPCLDSFALVAIRYARHTDLGHRRVGGKHLFYFPRPDLEAARFDD